MFCQTVIDFEALLDEGIQWSIITTRVCEKLNLDAFQTKTIRLPTFEEQSTALQNREVAKFVLADDDSGLILIETSVVSFIATPIQNQIPTKVASFSYLRGLKLAHPVSDMEFFYVDILTDARILI